MTRYLMRFTLTDGRVVVALNSFPPNSDGLQIMRYYAAPRIERGGTYAGARVEFAPCQYDTSLEPDTQKDIGEWKELPL